MPTDAEISAVARADLGLLAGLRRRLQDAPQPRTQRQRRQHDRASDPERRADADEVEDVAQVFEGLVPAGSGGFDDDELKEELEAMMEEEDGSASESSSVQASVSDPVKALEEASGWDSFPSAPASNNTSNKSKKEDRQALLSAVG